MTKCYEGGDQRARNLLGALKTTKQHLLMDDFDEHLVMGVIHIVGLEEGACRLERVTKCILFTSAYRYMVGMFGTQKQIAPTNRHT